MTVQVAWCPRGFGNVSMCQHELEVSMFGDADPTNSPFKIVSIPCCKQHWNKIPGKRIKSEPFLTVSDEWWLGVSWWLAAGASQGPVVGLAFWDHLHGNLQWLVYPLYTRWNINIQKGQATQSVGGRGSADCYMAFYLIGSHHCREQLWLKCPTSWH